MAKNGTNVQVANNRQENKRNAQKNKHVGLAYTQRWKLRGTLKIQ